jgi:hypothetical protein
VLLADDHALHLGDGVAEQPSSLLMTELSVLGRLDTGSRTGRLPSGAR